MKHWVGLLARRKHRAGEMSSHGWRDFYPSMKRGSLPLMVRIVGRSPQEPREWLELVSVVAGGGYFMNYSLLFAIGFVTDWQSGDVLSFLELVVASHCFIWYLDGVWACIFLGIKGRQNYVWSWDCRKNIVIIDVTLYVYGCREVLTRVL